MSGKNLYSELTSKRDYSGSKADEYAQLLETLLAHLGDNVYKLLEKASLQNKKLSINDKITNSDIIYDEYNLQDVVFI
jgi:hypothetical protein